VVKLILIYFLNEVGFKPGGSCKYRFTHKQYTKQQNEIEYNTYIRIKIYKHIISIYKHNHINTKITELNRNTTISTQ